MAEHQFEVEIAMEVGVEAAVIFSNINYWIKKNKANDKHFYNGTYWTYNSIKAFKELFPYMSESQIRRRLDILCETGLLEKGEFNKANFDKTNWYSVNYKIVTSIRQIRQMELSESSNGFGKIDKPIPYSKLTDSKHKVSDDTLFDNIDVSINNNKDITNTIIGESEKIENEFVERQKKCRKDMIEFFCKEYWPTYKFVGGRDGKAINEMIEHSKKHIEFNSGDSSPEGIFAFFKIVVQNLPPFYKSKNLATINSDYSGIIKQIENGNQTRNNKPTSEFAGRAFRELQDSIRNSVRPK